MTTYSFTVILSGVDVITNEMADTIDEAQANVVELAELWVATGHERAKDEAIRH